MNSSLSQKNAKQPMDGQESTQNQLADIIFYTAQSVRQVLSGSSLTDALEHLPNEQKAAVQSISFYNMRYLATSQALSQLLLSKKAPNPLVQSLLLVALSLLFAAKKRETTPEEFVQNIPLYQDFTIVNETLKAAEKYKKSAPFKGLLNACLRRYLREESTLWEQVQEQEVVQYNYPQWWIDLIRQSYPEHWQSLLNVANVAGPLTLRINKRKITREDYIKQLDALNIKYTIAGDDAVILDKAIPVQKIPLFHQGYCAVQDLGAQQAASLLPLKEGLRILDACAAPGGKTAHILERADVYMTALDIDEKRLERVKENLQHLGLMSDKCVCLVADASSHEWWNGEPFDMIMADVPCTASGIVRRHPDIKWLRQESDIAKTAQLQRQIVKNLWKMLKPNGYFLYITCSVFPQEGEKQAVFIEETFADAERLNAPGQLLPLATDKQVRPLHDGFFYALFTKKGE